MRIIVIVAAALCLMAAIWFVSGAMAGWDVEYFKHGAGSMK